MALQYSIRVFVSKPTVNWVSDFESLKLIAFFFFQISVQAALSRFMLPSFYNRLLFSVDVPS